MGTHMKTTVEIGDALLERAKATAAREGTTLRALIEEGLRRALEERHRPRRFRLRDASVEGHGLRPDADGADWARLRELAYEGRGG